MDILILLEANPHFLWVIVGIFSLLIGSFLNAVIYRIPLMLERAWKRDCQEILEKNTAQIDDGHTFNLLLPSSHCPHCGHSITALENIPILSYLFLKGKCSACHNKISVEYPIIEIVTTVLSILLAWRFGYSAELLASLLLLWTLIVLFMIDAKTLLLPDNIIYPLLWLGIVVNFNSLFTDLESSIVGAISGYLSLWLVYHLFLLITGKHGMGHGDFKLLAALGAWGGWQVLPFIVMSAAPLGAIIGAIWMYLAHKDVRTQVIPFGPWLAITGFCAIVWRDDIMQFMGLYFI
jgi:leader peptidase (prepilin peptidase)/N-methyltransferase